LLGGGPLGHSELYVSARRRLGSSGEYCSSGNMLCSVQAIDLSTQFVGKWIAKETRITRDLRPQNLKEGSDLLTPSPGDRRHPQQSAALGPRYLYHSRSVPLPTALVNGRADLSSTGHQLAIAGSPITQTLYHLFPPSRRFLAVITLLLSSTFVLWHPCTSTAQHGARRCR
jgi:hypothetical protein